MRCNFGCRRGFFGIGIGRMPEDLSRMFFNNNCSSNCCNCCNNCNNCNNCNCCECNECDDCDERNRNRR